MPVPKNLAQMIKAGDTVGLAQALLQDPAVATALQGKPADFVGKILHEAGKINADAMARLLTVGDFWANSGADASSVLPQIPSDQVKAVMLYYLYALKDVNEEIRIKMSQTILQNNPGIIDTVEGMVGSEELVKSIVLMFARKQDGVEMLRATDNDPERYYGMLQQAQFAEESSEAKFVARILPLMVQHYGKPRLGIPGLQEDKEQQEEVTSLVGQVTTIKSVVDFRKSQDALVYLITGVLPEYLKQKVGVFHKGQSIDAEIQRQLDDMRSKLPPGMTEDKIQQILEKKKVFLIKNLEKQKGKFQVYEDSKRQFDAIMAERGFISQTEIMELLNTVTYGKVDADLANMISGDTDWDMNELAILLNNMDNAARTSERFKGKFKAFNHKMGVDTSRGFVHDQVPNAGGFTIHINWSQLPARLKAITKEMMSTSKGHAGGGNVIGWMAVTPFVETKKLEDGTMAKKKIWYLHEIQSDLIANIGKKTSGSGGAEAVNNYFGDWYKMLYNYAIRMAKAKQVDELWIAPATAALERWPDPDKGDIPGPAWTRIYDDAAQKLGATKQKLAHDVPYMGEQMSWDNSNMWVLPVSDIPREKIANKITKEKAQIMSVRLSNRTPGYK